MSSGGVGEVWRPRSHGTALLSALPTPKCLSIAIVRIAVTVVTGAPRSVFLRELPPQGFTFRRATLDSGAQQVDAFSVDQRRSLEEYYKTAVQQRQAILESEVGWLSAIHADLVVSDIVPLAAAAAAAALLPCICVSNFSWGEHACGRLQLRGCCYFVCCCRLCFPQTGYSVASNVLLFCHFRNNQLQISSTASTSPPLDLGRNSARWVPAGSTASSRGAGGGPWLAASITAGAAGGRATGSAH